MGVMYRPIDVCNFELIILMVLEAQLPEMFTKNTNIMKLSEVPIIKTIFTATFLLAIWHSSQAQLSLEGIVKNAKGETLPFSNVLLLNPSDSALVKGNVADKEGIFYLGDIAPGEYLINAMMVGYRRVYQFINIDGEDTAPVDIQMEEDTRQLDEVMITAKKPLYEKKADRMVINVQSKATSAGRSALEVLERSPGVMVNRQNSAISMHGKSGVRVMINGKMTQMPIDAVVQMLNGMNAANIEKIELITTPPAKYDAEGNAGIINIVMVENTELGTNGDFGLTAGYNQAETLGGNFNLNHRGNRFNYFVNYSILSDNNTIPWLNQWTFNSSGNAVIDRSDQERNVRLTVQNFQAGANYELTSKTSVDALLTGYQRLWDMYDAFTDNTRSFPLDSVVHTEMDILEVNKWSSLTGNIGINHRFDDQQNLTMNYDYLYYIHDNPSSYDFSTAINEGPRENYLIDVYKETPVKFHVFTLAYASQFGKQFSIAAGAKFTYSNFENNVEANTIINDEIERNQEYTSFSTLNEKIMAAYVSWNWQISDQLKMDGGVRYEHTDTYLSTPEQPGLVDREFGNFFPSLNASFKPEEESSVQASYSRRITRPTYNDMAPFVFFIGPATNVGGNPALRPAIADNLDFTYNYKFWWISVKYSDIDNTIGWLQPEIYPDTYQVTTRSHNGDYERIWSASTGLPFNIAPWWEVQTDFSLYQRNFKTLHYEENPETKRTYFSANATSTFTLPNSFFLELSGNYLSASFWGVWEFGPQSQVNISVKKELGNSTLTLSFNDIFHDYVMNGFIRLPQHDVANTFTYDLNLRSVNLTFTKSFGSKKLKAVEITSGSEDERKRVN